MMTYAEWSKATAGHGGSLDEYAKYKRRENEPRINSGALFHRAGLEPDGETQRYPCIEIGEVQVYAYVRDGGLVVSVHLDGASGGVFALYGADRCVPVTINVGDATVYEAGPE